MIGRRQFTTIPGGAVTVGPLATNAFRAEKLVVKRGS